MRILGRDAAVFAEPAGATGFAGLLKMLREDEVEGNERVVVLVTGNGLKDTETAIKAAGKPHTIEPTIEAVRALVSQQKGGGK
jgi:threonine synthase